MGESSESSHLRGLESRAQTRSSISTTSHTTNQCSLQVSSTFPRPATPRNVDRQNPPRDAPAFQRPLPAHEDREVRAFLLAVIGQFLACFRRQRPASVLTHSHTEKQQHQLRPQTKQLRKQISLHLVGCFCFAFADVLQHEFEFLTDILYNFGSLGSQGVDKKNNCRPWRSSQILWKREETLLMP